MQKLLILNFIVLMTCMSPLKLSAQPKLNAAKVDRNVVFGMYSGLALLMDIYYPENPNGEFYKNNNSWAWIMITIKPTFFNSDNKKK